MIQCNIAFYALSKNAKFRIVETHALRQFLILGYYVSKLTVLVIKSEELLQLTGYWQLKGRYCNSGSVS
jgi:hypothetical protein